MKNKDKRLKVNLQFFAEGEGNQPPADPNAGGSDPTPPNGGETLKTFTQDDVNNLVAKEAKKAQEKLFKELGIEDFNSAKEGLEKFREWQEDQKTEAQKQAEQLQQLEQNFSSTKEENEVLKAQLSALKHKAKAESVQDVVTLAKTMVSDDVDMETAIKNVLEKYPHFKEQEQEQQQSGFKIGGSGQGTGQGGSVDPFVVGLGLKK